MNIYKLLLVAVTIISNLGANEYTFSKTASFNPLLSNGYELCEANATQMIKKEALKEYMGCSTDISPYDVITTFVKQGDRNITLDKCTIESTYSVKSKYLDKNDWLRGRFGAICMNYDTRLIKERDTWHNFELGFYMGFTGAQNSLEMSSSQSKIYYNYDKVPLYGLSASYAYKLFNSQYIGAKFFIATALETYKTSNTSMTKSRNDGNPAILRYGGGFYYGYRYHLKTELSAGVNYVSDSITRTYTNNSYTASVTAVNIEIGAGYYLLSYFKLWGSLSSDSSMRAGVSWVW